MDTTEIVHVICPENKKLTILSHHITASILGYSSFQLSIDCLPTFLKCMSHLTELDISGTQVTEIPAGLNQLIKLDCSDCSQLTTIAPLPEVQEINCYETAVTRIGSFPRLKRLNCGFTDVAKLSAENLPLLEMLYCNFACQLETIPSFPKLNYLYCRGDSLKHIPSLPKLEFLLANGNTRLHHIGELPRLETAELKSCTALVELPVFPSIETLECHKSGLRYIPTMPGLIRLECDKCASLTSIYDQPKLRGLFVSDCPRLESIPSLLLLERLESCNCPHLRRIGDMPNLNRLYTSNCFSLTDIGQMPLVEIIECDGCPSLTYIPLPTNVLPIDWTRCPLLPDSPDYDPEAYPRLIRVQCWLKRCIFTLRLLRLVRSSSFMEIYMTPGCRGSWLAQREWNARLQPIL